MNEIAFIFPGQGSQVVGMGKDFYEKYPVAKEVFNDADRILGYKISDICFNGPDDVLMLTENTQPAILTTSIAILRVLEQHNFKCDFTAGLSLGEYTSLVNAETIDFSESLKLVRNRGLYMQNAVPNGLGRMGAIVGLTKDQIIEIIEYSKEEGLIEIANYNTYEQIVVSGEKKAVNVALKKAKEMGARKAMPLLVSAPFHCSLLEPAGIMLSKDLNEIDIKKPNISFIANVNASMISDKDLIKQSLIKQVSNSVLWLQTVEFMIEKGVRTFIEIGPGSSLSNFAKSIASNIGVEVVSESISDVESLENVISVLSK